MKQSSILKPGDAVPVEHDLYYVVEKPFIKPENTNKDEDYSFYKVGETIAVEASRFELYVKSYKDFLKNNCRMATEQEICDAYNEFYSNVRVGEVYNGGSYCIRRFFVIKSNLNEIMEKFDMEKDNCHGMSSEMKNLINGLCGSREIWAIRIGCYNGIMFIYTDYFDKYIEEAVLKICRKATQEEATEFSRYVFQIEEGYRKKYEEEQRKKEEEKAKIYEANKSNPEYYPGAVGNFKQVVLEEGKKVVSEKEYSLAQIKSFYESLLSYKKLSNEVKRNMIFYGGTIPYVLCNESGDTRKFGDVDIFVPVRLMKQLRNELSSELDYIYDSLEITKRIGLTSKGFYVRTPHLWWDRDYESYTEYMERRYSAELEANENAIYQDYGFKAVLFGINISVFPLYDWTFKDGSIGVCAKSFRLSKEISDWNFLLNTIVSKEITIDQFYNEKHIFDHDTRVAKIEYTIASKRNAIRFGYILRNETDEVDLKYIESHRSELDIDENQVEFFTKNIPDYGISHVYRVTRSYEVKVIGPEEYKHLVTRNDKPS